MKLLTRWQTWFVPGRDEQKFHCDLILEPGDEMVIAVVSEKDKKEHRVYLGKQFAKVHLAASWEFRDTEFAE